MRLRLCGLILATMITLPAMAQEARSPAIEATIQGQITAFLAEDVTTAFTFAAPNIKTIFGTAENFGAMVKQGYPMVWHPSAVRMLELRNEQGSFMQRVMVTDDAGRTHLLDYQMLETADGWQINGVQLLPDTGVGA
jgi:Domain of unknown function (DUF4864)